MLSLNDLRSPAAGLDWHEAVAVGAALGTLLAEARAPACPRPVDVTLLPSGDLRVTGPGHVEGSAAAGVAHLVGQLLEAAPYPAELRQLVEAYATDRRSGAAGVEAITDFVSELAFFERPGRRDVLSAVALRAEPAIERAHRAAALEALTERTRLAAAAGPASGVVVPSAHGEFEDVEGPRDWGPPHDGGAGRLLVQAAVGLTAFLAVGYAATAWLDRPAPPSPRAEAIEEDLPISGPDSGTAPTASPRPSVVPPRERPSGGPVSTPSTVDVSRPSAAASGASAVTPAAAPQPRAVDVVVAERDGRVVPSTVAPLRPPPRQAPAGQVFQAGDPQVTPAVLIRPHLPDNPPPDVPEEHIGTLEFVVTESGAVEHVHLVSPANRYQERMLVAAAKTWQFRPATRDGRPVRFRTRIRVTL
jgi:Gram-negative bacterial TonB protein C-terminal